MRLGAHQDSRETCARTAYNWNNFSTYIMMLLNDGIMSVRIPRSFNVSVEDLVLLL